MDLGELPYESPGYSVALALRHRVLREPLGVEWTEAEQAWEPRERHFALWDDGQLVACVSARPLEEGRCKLRQMAVEPIRQGEGLGRELLEKVEAALQQDGVEEIELNARQVAVGFYENLGYRTIGDEFVEVGIPHWKMQKGMGKRG
jgi:predicted GNAT family N-acyltransferase